MRQCAFLTMDTLENYQCYDHLLYAPLERLGWKTTAVSWGDTNVTWDDFEAVIIRSPWDYQDDAERFMELLETIESSSARLENAQELVKWNINKSYLRNLEDCGIHIVPTLFGNHFNRELGLLYFAEFGCEVIVIKPAISANADDTFRLTQNDWMGSNLNLTAH